MSRHAFVVGASRGLGLAMVEKYLAEGWKVTATTRDVSPALEAMACDQLTIHLHDITDVEGLKALRAKMAGETINVIHIVAGVFQKTFDDIWDQPDDEILRVIKTNSIAGIRVCEVFADIVADDGVFAFTSSGMGSMTRNNDIAGVDLYRISKASLNMLARSLAVRQAGTGRSVVILCPGWAKTDMGGADATVEVADSVNGMYDVIMATKPTADGARFIEYSGDTIPW